jgi:uncharacterized iron-regulated membrane protein
MMGKASLLRLHKYFGLVAAAFLFVQALTGLTLVYGADLAQLVDPAGMISAPGGGDATPSALIAAAEARYGDFHVSRLVYPETADGTYFIHLANGRGEKRYVSLDRHKAAILRAGNIWHFPIVAAFNIHDQWMSGRLGMVVVAVAGTMLLLLAGTGLAFWWPRRGRIRQSLKVNTQLSIRLVLRQLHRSTGVVISTLLAFMAVTGLFIVIPTIVDGPPANWESTRSFAPRVGPALDLARQAFPGRAVRDIRMPKPDEIHIFFNAPERNSRAVHRVVVDTGEGRVLSVRNAFDDKAAWVIALPLHSGAALGWLGRLIILVGGLSLLGLSATGPIIWLQARRARRPRGPSNVRGAGASAAEPCR